MFVEGEPVLAFCPLKDPDDTDNRIYLTDESVVIVRRKRSFIYKRNQIKKITLRHRIYLIPVIAGGIMAPLAITALISGLGDPWWLLMLILGGIFLFYYGIQGGPALSVFTPVKDFDTFLPAAGPSLRAFISYVTWQLKQTDDHIYLLLSPDEYESARQAGTVPAGTRIFLHAHEVPGSPAEDIRRMDAGGHNLSLRFQEAPGGKSVSILLGAPVPFKFLLEK